MLKQLGDRLRTLVTRKAPPHHEAPHGAGAPGKRIALVGAGVHSRTCHAPALREYASRHGDTIELAAVCTRTIAKARRFREEFGFTNAYASIEEMLAHERIDACVCVLPTDQIASTGILFLKRGIPVLLEKPVALTVSDLESLLAAARETGTPHMVSLNRRYNPCLTSAVSWCKEQGEIRFISGTMLRHGRTDRTFLVETGIHALDALCSIGGALATYQLDELRGDASATTWYVVTLQFKSGCRAVLEILPTSGTHQETYSLHGTGFSATASLMGEEGPLTLLYSGDQCQRVSHPQLSGKPHLDGSFQETTAFLEAVLQNRTPRPTIFDVEEATRMVLSVTAHDH